jgi:prepilin-type N-terminal cleavage/methylation domain-containing protein
MQRHADGFTLVEMAIVLAIIALITGAVLMSWDSIFGRAGVVSLLSNIKDLATASRDFKARYSYFPGDLPNAGTYITANGSISPGCSYPVAGNVGNGIVDTPTESDCALEHLVKAGMLSKANYDGSKYVITSNVGVGVRLSLWYNPATNDNVIRISNLPCDVALEIDRKLDSATATNTPFNQGSVLAASDPLGATLIPTCSASPANDPVPTLLIKY